MLKSQGFTNYLSLLKVLLIETFFGENNILKKKKESSKQINNGNGAKKIIGILLIIFCVVFILGYLIMMVYSITQTAVAKGIANKVPYFLMGTTQVFIVLFGISMVFNCLYFSKDNTLLMSLPISSKVIFAAKMTIIYLSQLFISFVILFPSLITFGIVVKLNGITYGFGFYLFSIISPLVAPALPLVVISIIAVPIMYLLSFVKNKSKAKTILSSILSLGIVAMYLVIVFVFEESSIENGEGNLILPILYKFAELTIYNYNWIEAMCGNHIIINGLIYIGIIIGAFTVSFIINAISYKKCLKLNFENNVNRKKKINNEKVYTRKKLIFSFLLKDLKILISEPNLLISTVLGMIFVPVFFVIFHNIGVVDIYEMEGLNSGNFELITLGLISYLVILFMGSGNYMSLVGFSIEGKNINLLKSLPIKPKSLIKIKLIVSNVFNLLITIEFFVLYLVYAEISLDYIYSIIVSLSLLCIGFGLSSFGLYSDFKNPYFEYSNMQQLIKNNKRLYKPIIIGMIFGLFAFIMGIIMAMTIKNELLAHFIYCIILCIGAALFALLMFKKLWKNSDSLYENLEV